ncbi:MAG TPA: hypothetical protein VLB74_13015 [Flavobacterium sp.]|uniref:hypothetical protein n=1 Tax=Flavobacterium sp. TaxID=239 RepID=UPI002B9CC9D3|nr:hypothetical protein [Flavobacterium sp.]HSD15565.1 hypothetical protein [Flavobacterium sp.]
MKRGILLLLLLLSAFQSFSQELAAKTPIKFVEKSDVFQIVEEKEKRICFFLTDKKNIKILRFNNDFGVLDSLSVTRPSEKFDQIIGYSISQNKYFIFWSNSRNKEIIEQCFNMNDKSVNTNAHSLVFDKEKPLKKITVNNLFYLITLVKSSNKLNFYRFTDGQFDKKTVDFSQTIFLNASNKPASLWSVFNEKSRLEEEMTLQTISDDTPPSLVLSAHKRKMYIKENVLTITLDNNSDLTQILKIDLNDFSSSTNSIPQPEVAELDLMGVDSNSFLMPDQIIQMKTNSEKMFLLVKDLNGKLLKSNVLNPDEEISIKNSEVVQENGSIKKAEVINEPGKLLRKLNKLHPSLSCYSVNDNLCLTIGGVSPPPNNNNAIAVGAVLGGLTGALIVAAITSNSSAENLLSYKDRKVIYVNCLFDNQFNHLSGNVENLAFDSLRAFAEEKHQMPNQTVFKFDNNLYFGFYNNEEQNYSFYRF